MAICYMLMVEYWKCAEPEPCDRYWRCKDQKTHARTTEWVPYRTVSMKLGPIHGHIGRIAGNVARGMGETGNHQIMVLDTDQLKPLWSEGEQAAYRIGGLKAVQAMQKAALAEQKKQVRRARGNHHAHLPPRNRCGAG